MGNRISKYFNREKDIKVIFLDFDGVLNNEFDSYEKNGIVKFNQSNMKNLKTLVNQTNAVFVLSTAHRYRKKRLFILKLRVKIMIYHIKFMEKLSITRN